MDFVCFIYWETDIYGQKHMIYFILRHRINSVEWGWDKVIKICLWLISPLQNPFICLVGASPEPVTLSAYKEILDEAWDAKNLLYDDHI